MRVFFFPLIVLLLSISGCKDSSTSSLETTTYEKYVKEPETGLPLSVDASQTLLFNLEASGNAGNLDSGGDGYDEYTLVLPEDENKRFCLGEDTNMSIEIYKDDTLLETVSNSCKSLELKKGEYLIRLHNKDEKDHLLHVENRSGNNYTTMDIDTSRLHLDPQNTTSSAKQRTTFDETYSVDFDTMIFQTAKCTGCNLYGIDLSHYNYGDYPSDMDGFSMNYLNAQDISLYSIESRYMDNTEVAAYVMYDYADFRDANLSYSVFNFVQFNGSDLEGADLSYSIFRGCSFTDSNLKDVNFEGAIFLDSEFTTGSATTTEFRSKPSLFSMYFESILDVDHTWFRGFLYTHTSLGVLMSDGNIWIQPNLDSDAVINIGSPEGKQIVSHPEMSWWADQTTISYKNYFEDEDDLKQESRSIAYVVTDGGALYYKEYTLYGLDESWEVLERDDVVSEWIQLNDDSTSCVGAPVASTTYEKTGDDLTDFILTTNVRCEKASGEYYSFTRSISYTYEAAFDDDNFNDTGYSVETISTPSGTTLLTGANAEGVNVFVGFGDDGNIDNITLKDDTKSQSFSSDDIFKSDAYAYVDIATFTDDSVASYYSLFSLYSSGNAIIGAQLLRTDISTSFEYASGATLQSLDYFTTLVSGIDVSTQLDTSEGYVAAIDSEGAIEIYDVIADTWSVSPFSTSSSMSDSDDILTSFDGTNFSNAFFGRTTKNSKEDEASGTSTNSKVIPAIFDGVEGLYIYNFYFSDAFTFNDLSSVVFDSCDLDETIFSGTHESVELRDSTLTCNTLDNAIITDWSMNGSTWEVQDGCLNTAKNTTIDASSLAPTLSGDELLKFDLSDAQNIIGFSAIDFSSKDMSSMQMTYADLSGSAESFTQLGSSTWSDANISNLTCTYCDLEDASMLVETAQNMLFSNSYLVGITLGGDFTNSAFTDSQIDGITVNASTSLNLASFTNVTTNGLIPNHTTCSFDNANLSGATFSGVYLQDCSFNGANLSAAKTFNDAIFVQNDFANTIFSSGTLSINESAFYGSCFDGVATTDVTQTSSTFVSDGSVNTSLIYDLRDGTTYDGIDVTYKLIDGCSNYQPN